MRGSRYAQLPAFGGAAPPTRSSSRSIWLLLIGIAIAIGLLVTQRSVVGNKISKRGAQYDSGEEMDGEGSSMDDSSTPQQQCPPPKVVIKRAVEEKECEPCVECAECEACEECSECKTQQPCPACPSQSNQPTRPVETQKQPPSVEEALAVVRRTLAEMKHNGRLSLLESIPPTAKTVSGPLSDIDRAFAEYAALHAKILDPADRSVPKAFIGWSMRDYIGAGLGNRLLGFISTLALAMATNRAFLLVNDDLVGGMLSPAPVSQGGINWEHGVALAAYRAQHNGAAPDEQHLGHGMGVHEWCGCEDWRASKASTPLITVESTQYFFPCVSHNPAYRGYFKALTGGSYQFTRLALQRYARFSSGIAAELDAFDRAKLHPPVPPAKDAAAAAAVAATVHKRRYVVGMQIRTGHLIRSQHEEQAFYKCAKAVAAKAAMAPQQYSSDSTDVDNSDGTEPVGAAGAFPSFEQAFLAVEKAIRNREMPVPDETAPPRPLTSEPIREELDVYYFLATDDSELRSRARQVFGDRLIVYEGGQDGAAMDMLLLSRCDDVILTWPKSTYGSVGAALMSSGRPPHVVMSGGKRGNECVQLMTNEPCFHGWFDRWKLSCYSKAGWETPEMLNQDNCYYCQADTDRCPSEDRCDQFLQFTSPLDYEALVELGPQRYMLPSTTQADQLAGTYRQTYDSFVQRVGTAPHPYVEPQ